MSRYAEIETGQIDLGAQWASIAIREQLKEIHRGIQSLVTTPKEAGSWDLAYTHEANTAK